MFCIADYANIVAYISHAILITRLHIFLAFLLMPFIVAAFYATPITATLCLL